MCSSRNRGHKIHIDIVSHYQNCNGGHVPALWTTHMISFLWISTSLLVKPLLCGRLSFLWRRRKGSQAVFLMSSSMIWRYGFLANMSSQVEAATRSGAPLSGVCWFMFPYPTIQYIQRVCIYTYLYTCNICVYGYVSLHIQHWHAYQFS